MIPFRCFYQAGQISEEQRSRLAEHLTRLANEATGEAVEAAPVDWVEIAEGFGFTAGKPSQSSVVISAVPDDTDQDIRVDLMRGICDAWSLETGCSVNDIVATAVNVSLAIKAQA